MILHISDLNFVQITIAGNRYGNRYEKFKVEIRADLRRAVKLLDY